MRDKILVLLLGILLFPIKLNAQVLPVKAYQQEQSNWCWAAVTQSVLDYYGYSLSQCEIVNFARERANNGRYGTEDCCENPTGQCNGTGYSGIGMKSLIYVGLKTSGVISLSAIKQLLGQKKPLILSVRLGETDLSHALVLYGVTDNSLHIMDPEQGKYKIAYNDFVEHIYYHWQQTYIPQRAPVDLVVNESKIVIFPNPTDGLLNLSIVLQNREKTRIELVDMRGATVLERDFFESYVLTSLTYDLKPGLYIVRVVGESFSYTEKLMVN
jgi:hypothetical protein